MVARRSFIAGLLATLGLSKVSGKESRASFPPVPKWQPSFTQPKSAIIDRMLFYTSGKRDLAVFRNGTCVMLAAGLSDEDAEAFALKTLDNIFNFHPDMNPMQMNDGNVLVSYNHPAANVVLREIAEANWQEIEKRHLDGLAAQEVLITPLGQNKFDALGKQALLGRAYMFMDAQSPEIIRIERVG